MDEKIVFNTTKKASTGLNGQFLISKKSLVIILNVIGLGTLGIIGAGVGIGLTQYNNKDINLTCEKDSNCMKPLVCDDGICGCKTFAYYNGSTCGKFLLATILHNLFSILFI
jgi:hypothetical protein